jgi:hypothetical protein
MNAIYTGTRFVCGDCAAENYNPGSCSVCNGRTEEAKVILAVPEDDWRAQTTNAA